MEQNKFEALLSKFKQSWTEGADVVPSADFRRNVANAIRREAALEPPPSVLDLMLDYAESFGFGLAAASMLFALATFSRGPIIDQVPIDSMAIIVG